MLGASPIAARPVAAPPLSAPSGGPGYPVLSGATVIAITSTTATPQVTITI